MTGLKGYIWAGFSIITAVWAFFMVPETKGLSLEQVDFLYDKRTNTRAFRHHVFAHDVAADEVVEEAIGEKDGNKVAELELASNKQ